MLAVGPNLIKMPFLVASPFPPSLPDGFAPAFRSIVQIERDLGLLLKDYLLIVISLNFGRFDVDKGSS